MLYVETKMPEGVGGAQVRDGIFFDLQEDQINLVNARYNGKKAISYSSPAMDSSRLSKQRKITQTRLRHRKIYEASISQSSALLVTSHHSIVNQNSCESPEGVSAVMRKSLLHVSRSSSLPLP
jgi:hypothetical protein